MLGVYLFALVVGIVPLAVSLAGGDHQAGHDAALDHGDGDHGAGALSLVASLRFWTNLLAFGGATGTLLRLVAHTPEPLAALLSLGVGAVAGLFAQFIFARATRNSDGGVMGERELIGRVAHVLVPFARAQTGKVRLHVRESLVDVLATTDDERELAEKEEVVILDMQQGRAVVGRAKE